MATLNGFSVAIKVADQEMLPDIASRGTSYAGTIRGSSDPMNGSYFSVPDGSEYAIVLRNMNTTDCDADVTIDGEKIGRYRISAFGEFAIERPEDTSRRFKFVAEGSAIARQAGIETGKNENGLVKVTFYPSLSMCTSSLENYCASMPFSTRCGYLRNQHQHLQGNTAPYQQGTSSGDDVFGQSAAMARSDVVRRMPAAVNKATPSLYSDMQYQNSSDGKSEMHRLMNTPLGGGSGQHQGLEEENCANGFCPPGAAAASSGTIRNGATVLGADSGQKFRSVPDIVDIDRQKITTVHVRLMAIMLTHPRQPFVALKDRHETGVPPRVPPNGHLLVQQPRPFVDAGFRPNGTMGQGSIHTQSSKNRMPSLFFDSE